MARSGHSRSRLANDPFVGRGQSRTFTRVALKEQSTMRASRFVLILAFALATCGAVAFAQLQSPADAKWGPAPPALPPGAEIAVLSGDPGKPAPYAVRLRFPANYKIPAHSHPTDENVVDRKST